MGRQKEPLSERAVYSKIRAICKANNIGYIKIPDSVYSGSKRFIPRKICDIILLSNGKVVFLEIKYCKKSVLDVSRRLVQQCARMDELRKISPDNVIFMILVYSKKTKSYYIASPGYIISMVVDGNMLINLDNLKKLNKQETYPKIQELLTWSSIFHFLEQTKK